MSLKLIKLVEPSWAEKILVLMNDYVHKHEVLIRLVPMLSDIFVFTYPVYLAGLYLYGINKRNDFYKEASIYILLSGVSSILTNLFIQLFFDKQRPEQLVLSKNNLIFTHVPDSPFPSDHAALSGAIAMATLLVGIKNKDKSFIIAGIIFRIFCIVMSFSRVAAGVHWLTDVLVGMVVGSLIALFLFKDCVYGFLKKVVMERLITVEKKIFSALFGIKQ